MRGKTAKQYRNYGELLYTEGLTKRENQQKLVEKKKKEDEAKELSELTGIPEIRLVVSYLEFLIPARHQYYTNSSPVVKRG